MEDKLRQEAISKKYDGIQDITLETLLPRAVVSATLPNKGCEDFSVKHYVCDMIAKHGCFGKDNEENANKEVIIVELNVLKEYLLDFSSDKIVFIIDGERMPLEIAKKSMIEDFQITPDYFIHFNNGFFGLSPDEDSDYKFYAVHRCFTLGLTPELIKKISDAQNVSIYLDPEWLIDANGGIIPFTKDEGSFQIEGIQGFMKRVYHFFVDETCYTEYCESFYEERRKRSEQIKKKLEKEKKEDHEYAIKLRNILFVVLFVSVLLIILNLSCDWDSTFWTLILPLIAGGYSVYKLGYLYDLW